MQPTGMHVEIPLLLEVNYLTCEQTNRTGQNAKIMPTSNKCGGQRNIVQTISEVNIFLTYQTLPESFRSIHVFVWLFEYLFVNV